MDTNILVVSALIVGFAVGSFLRGLSKDCRYEQNYITKLETIVGNCQALVGLWSMDVDPQHLTALDKTNNVNQAVDVCVRQLTYVLEIGELPKDV
jgi:hypothetical protein